MLTYLHDELGVGVKEKFAPSASTVVPSKLRKESEKAEIFLFKTPSLRFAATIAAGENTSYYEEVGGTS